MTVTNPSPSHTVAPATTARYSGLDGLRALAVTLVVVYHLFPSWWLGQGFIGVDVFFVISGFLITSLLLRETDATGRIRYGDFWRRRARRLLPALVTLIVVCGLWAWVVGGDVLVGFGRQVVGALTFSFNWVSIGAGEGYFATANPELFRNLWSLAVEEQFYVLWPILLPLLLLIPSRAVRTAVALLAATASAAWMGAPVLGGGDLTRAYFGTDTHGFGILIGVALAFALHRGGGAAPVRRGHAVRALTSLVGAAAVVGIVAVAALPQSADLLTFPGALLAASALTAVAIAAAVQPGSLLGAALDTAPARWVGVRSYGIYLWHWPVLVLLMAAFTGAGAETGVPAWIGGSALAITLLASTVSYRFIEQPVRILGFRGSLRALGRLLRGTPRSRFAAITAVSAFALAACATTGAITAAPTSTSAEQVVADGAAALAAASASPIPSRTPAPTASATASPDATTTPAVTNTPDATTPDTEPEAEPAPSPTPVEGTEITAVGDSVMLASAPGLLDRLPGIQIDAAVSRSMWAGPGILESLAAAGQLRPYVVIALGTNGPVDEESLQRVADIVGPDRHLILVNAYAPRDWIPGVNDALTRFAAGRPNVRIADWSGAIDPHQDQLAGDRIHPGSSGGATYAETVASTVQAVEDARALRQFQREQALIRVTELSTSQFGIVPR